MQSRRATPWLILSLGLLCMVGIILFFYKNSGDDMFKDPGERLLGSLNDEATDGAHDAMVEPGTKIVLAITFRSSDPSHIKHGSIRRTRDSKLDDERSALLVRLINSKPRVIEHVYEKHDPDSYHPVSFVVNNRLYYSTGGSLQTRSRDNGEQTFVWDHPFFRDIAKMDNTQEISDLLGRMPEYKWP